LNKLFKIKALAAELGPC